MIVAVLITVSIVAAQSLDEQLQPSLFLKTKPLSYKTYESYDCESLAEECRVGGDCSMLNDFCQTGQPTDDIEESNHVSMQIGFVLLAMVLLTGFACVSCRVHRQASINKLKGYLVVSGRRPAAMLCSTYLH